ncbi:large ribosomal subunit protein eL6-like [Oscarella lobularis]|uniref:large ribosomal subunit protein eL6-like n=1 Tax=Oscarella lobularis TaxID=121494 RepID=UPI003313B7BE
MENSKKPHSSRNYLLPGGVSRYSRSVMYRKKALYKKKKITVAKKEVKQERFKEKPVRGDKNGGKRIVPLIRRSRYYPTEDVRRPRKTRKIPKTAKLRQSITPGTILIILSGHQRGKRVVFLKQLPSGLLLVTGPYKVNGCPLRRVDQAYVIATKMTVDLKGVKIPAELTDDFFKREKRRKKKKDEDMFEQNEEDAHKPKPSLVENQKTVDAQVIEAIKKVPQLRSYLRCQFGLSKGQYPHRMEF